MGYYKKIEEREYKFPNAPIALQKSYDKMKADKGTIVSSDENGEFILVPTEKIDEFIITSLSRQDIFARGFNADELTDEDMQEIADTMAELYIGYDGYWDELESECGDRGISFTNPDENEED